MLDIIGFMESMGLPMVDGDHWLNAQKFTDFPYERVSQPQAKLGLSTEALPDEPAASPAAVAAAPEAGESVGQG